MSKYKDLIKQVEFFERLALYGDRDSFLRALAQDAGNTTRVSLSPEFNTLPQDYTQLPPPPPPPMDQKPEIPEVSVEDLPKPAAPRKSPQYDEATITTLQTFLNEFLRPQIEAGKRGPLAQDGVVGPDTTAVLKQWGQYNGFNTNDIHSLINTALKKRA